MRRRQYAAKVKLSIDRGKWNKEKIINSCVCYCLWWERKTATEKRNYQSVVVIVVVVVVFVLQSLVCENKQEKFCCIYSPSPPHHLVGRSVININVNNARQQHNGLKVKWCCLFILTLKRLWMYVGFYFCSNIPPVGLFFLFSCEEYKKEQMKIPLWNFPRH